MNIQDQSIRKCRYFGRTSYSLELWVFVRIFIQFPDSNCFYFIANNQWTFKLISLSRVNGFDDRALACVESRKSNEAAPDNLK